MIGRGQRRDGLCESRNDAGSRCLVSTGADQHPAQRTGGVDGGADGALSRHGGEPLHSEQSAAVAVQVFRAKRWYRSRCRGSYRRDSDAFGTVVGTVVAARKLRTEAGTGSCWSKENHDGEPDGVPEAAVDTCSAHPGSASSSWEVARLRSHDPTFVPVDLAIVGLVDDIDRVHAAR